MKQSGDDPGASGRHSAGAGRRGSRSLAKWLIPTVGALVFLAIFSALGWWQLQRAEEKQVLQTEYDRRALDAPVRLGAGVQSADALQFAPVQASGFYEAERQLLLDNRSHRGAPGYHVITPLRIAGADTRVLVNRGWVPLGPDRQHVPDIAPPRGEVTVAGTAVVPHVGFALGEPDALSPDRPTVWQQLDLGRYAEEAGVVLQPIVILLDPRSGAGGYVRDWARLDAGIAVHRGYAFQWFALAATVMVLYLVWAVRRFRPGAPTGTTTR